MMKEKRSSEQRAASSGLLTVKSKKAREAKGHHEEE